MGARLSDEQVAELWDKWCTGRDPVVRNELVCHYLPVVDFVAARVARHVPNSYRPDLYGFGAMGLVDAIEKFKPELGNRFETYGTRRIRGAMSDGIRSLNWLPRGAGARASRIIEKIVPVDFSTTRNHAGVPLDDCLSDPDDASALELLELEADHVEVAEAIETLPERERYIVVQHYYARRRLAELGREMGVTESRVCQLHRRALRMLESALVEARQTA